MKKDYRKTIIKVCISGFLIIYLFNSIDKEAFLKNLASMNISYFPLIFSLVVINYFISSVRWKKIISIFENNHKASLFTLVKLYFIGAFFNNFLPTSVGGDVYKAISLGRIIGNKANAFASTFMERFSGVVVLGLLSVFGLVSTFGKMGFFVVALITFGGFFVFYLLKAFGKRFSKIKSFNESLAKYKHHKDVLFYAVFTSVFVQVCSVLTQYFIFRSLQADVSLFYAFFAFPVIILASFIIPSQNSFGVQDALYAAFFLNAGISVEVSLSASVIYHVIRLIVSMLGGLFYAIDR
ncbi:MAG: lysylphosphatidylglycerol synthase transmembrane domain-containing protein [Patescibacteria group bacterium]